MYPVSASTILTPPGSVILSDYYSIGSTSFQSILTFNDFAEISTDVRLKITIESSDIKIETKSSFIPVSQITLTPGVPLTLSGSDFYEYLNLPNVNLEGITYSALSSTGRIPEGFYNFCVEVLDYQTGVPVSLPGCASVYVFAQPPPIILAPICEEVVIPTDPQNIYFQWQMQGGASPQLTMGAKYKLYVYEVTDNDVDPYYAVVNNQALLVYESEFENLVSKSLDFSTTLLTAGKKFTFRVRAVDENESDVFLNNGYSEWCWFYYGYPDGGVIEINKPLKENVFSKTDQKLFEWTEPDNAAPGITYDYTLTIKEVEQNQTAEEAIESNTVWHSKSVSSSSLGASYLLDLALDPNKEFAYQVEAFAQGQKVAKSDVNVFYSPPLIEHFYAGDTKIEVLKLDNSDLSSLAGKGRFVISDELSDTINVEFSGIAISDQFGDNYLQSGEILFDLSEEQELELSPEIEDNGTANLLFSTGKLTTSGLEINGVFNWDFPHPVNDPELQSLKSEETWFQFNGGKLNGNSKISSESNSFELLDPSGFVINFDEVSKITVSENVYYLALVGNLEVVSAVTTNDSEPLVLAFDQIKELFYVEVDGLISSVENYIKPFDGLNIGAMPKTAIIDLSEKQSPGELNTNKAWKGIYFSEFRMRFFKNGFDVSQQLVLPQVLEVDLSADNTNKLWLSDNGLTAVFDFDFDYLEGMQFNTFATPLSGHLEKIDNQILPSSIKGEIKIPVIDKNDLFSYTVAVSEDGLVDGYLDEDLTGKSFVFNPYGGENRVDMAINRAVFTDNEYLQIDLNATLAAFNTTIENIDDFRAYGDGVIGVSARNGSQALTNQVVGEYNGFPVFIEEVGASLYGENYSFSYLASLDLGEEVVGEDGPPILAISSVEPSGLDNSASSGAPIPAITVPTTSDTTDNSKITATEMYVAVNSAIVDLEGYLLLTHNDPMWGTSFRGGINGEIKIPSQIGMGANIVLGNVDGYGFWYFDAWFNDKETRGIPVFGYFNLTALEGRIYRHMSKTEDEFIPNPDVDFGAGIYLQVIDNNGGALFAADIAAEVEVSDQNFIIQMEGDLSCINTETRPASSGMTSAVAGAIAEEVVNQVVANIGPISFDFDIAGGNLGLEAENLKAGNLTFKKSDLTVGVGADVNDAPALSFDFEKSSNKFSIAADASGNADLGFSIDDKEFGLSLVGTKAASFNFEIDNVSFESAVDRIEKTGSLKLALDQAMFDLAVATDGGTFNMDLGSNSFETGFKTTGSAFLGMSIEDNKFYISGDKSTGEGKFDLEVDGIAIESAINTNEKSGSINFVTDDFEVDFSGAYNAGGSFALTKGNEFYELSADLPTKSASITIQPSATQRYFAGIENGATYSIGVLENGVDLTVEYVHQTSGKLTLVKNDLAISVEGVYGKSGAFSVAKGDMNYSLSADITTQSGELLIQPAASSRYFASIANGNEYNINVTQDEFEFSGVYTSNTKSVGVKYSEVQVSAAKTNDRYELGLGYEENQLLLAKENSAKEVTYSNQSLAISYKNEALNIDDLQGNSLTISSTGIEENGSLINSVTGGIDTIITINNIAVNLKIVSEEYSLSFNNSGSQVLLKTNNFQNAGIDVNHNGQTYTALSDGSNFYISYNSIKAAYADEQVSIDIDESKGIKVSTEDLALNYDDLTVELYKDGEVKGINIAKGEDSFAVSTVGFEVIYDSKKFGLKEAELQFELDDSKNLTLSKTNFGLSYDGLEIEMENTSDVKGFKVSKDSYSFLVNNNGFGMEAGEKYFGFNKEEYLRVALSDQKYLTATNTKAELVVDDNRLAIGGDDNFLEIAKADKTIALTKESKILYSDDTYEISLSKSLEVGFSDGTRDITLFGNEHVVSYAQGDYSIGVRGGSGVTPGLDLSVGDNTIFLDIDKGNEVRAGVSSSDFGELSISSDKDKNFAGTFGYNGRELTLAKTADGLEFYDSDSTSTESADPENLDDATPTPDMSGPTYIDNKISDVDGALKGTASMYYNSAESHFIANAAVASTVPPCIDGAMAVEVKPDDFYLSVGSETQRVEVYPSCSGFGGGGWLIIDNDNLDVGVFAGFYAGGTAKIGNDVCNASLTAEIGAELGVTANADLEPFKINSAGIWLEAYAGLYAGYSCLGGSGSITIAEAYLRGELDVYFNSKVLVEGKLEGRINILDLIKANFKASFSEEL